MNSSMNSPQAHSRTFRSVLHSIILLPNDVILADLVMGWQVLAQPRNDTNSAILHRRQICGELAAIAASLTSEQGHLTGAVKAWQAWLDASQKSANPRLATMVKTCAREIMELQSVR